MSFQTTVSELIAANADYADTFDAAHAPSQPSRRLAVVTCMDARMDAFEAFGLRKGEAHIIRNAGGVITDDVIRSLCLSQRSYGTREIVLVHHTDCGLPKVDEAVFRAELENELGVKPWWSVEGFDDPYRDVRQSIERLLLTPFITHKENISGFVYEVNHGLLQPVDATNPSVPTSAGPSNGAAAPIDGENIDRVVRGTDAGVDAHVVDDGDAGRGTASGADTS